MNGAGEALVLWTDFERSESRLRFARYTPGAGWEPAELLTAASSVSSPSVALDDNGNALATWTQRETDEGRSAVMASRFTVGSGWSAPEELEQDLAVSATDVSLSMTPSGHALAVWSDVFTTGVIRGRLFEPDAGWGATASLSSADTGTAPATSAGVVLCRDGSAVALWGGGGQLDALGTPYNYVYVNRYDPANGWGEAESMPGTIQSIPQLRCDPEGRTAAVWAAPAHPQSSTFFARDDAANGWSSGFLHLGSYGAQLEFTGTGHALVVVHDQFKNSPVEAFLDAATEGPIEATADGELVSLDLASNATGQARALWARAAAHGDDIWLSARDPETGWGEAERLVASVPRCEDECFIRTLPRIAMDATGNTIVAWARRHDSHSDVVAQVLTR